MSGTDSSVVLRISNSMASASLVIKNAELKQGKFHTDDNKDDEISAAEVNKQVFPPQSTVNICASASSTGNGVEGSMELYDSDTKICRLYWKDPTSGENDFQVQDYQVGGTYYVVAQDSWNRSGGSLGKVDIEIAKR